MAVLFKKVITNVLIALYQPFFFAVLLSVLFMFFFLYAKEHGTKTVFLKWWNSFKSDGKFRRLFVLTFYTAMILFRTLLNRTLWANPLSNVMGSWSLYNAKGELSTEPIENLLLFIPFSALLMWTFKDKLLSKGSTLIRILWQSVKAVFLFSLSIEFLQLFLRLGTFQLSDLCYNTLGGLIGGFIYWIVYRINSKRR